jgi:hypothetical protein
VSDSTELLLKLGLTVTTLGVLIWRARQPERGAKAGTLLTIVAVAAAFAYTNFLTFHAGRFTHFGENFHYQLGSKYFPELGYDGLYDASIAAQAESHPALPLPRLIRDLRTNSIVPTASLAEHRAEVRARFTPARWRTFVRDHDYFLDLYTLRKLDEVRLDYGYNPTPTWTFVGRLFNAWLPINARTVPLLALLDFVLLGAMVAVAKTTFGGRAAAILVILVAIGYPWRYTWVGGGFLRYDWLAAVVIAVCMLARGRDATAGALLAYAAAVRLFPVLLLAGIAVVAVRDLIRRAKPTWVWRFAGGFVASAVLCALAGTLVGRGVAAWPEFVHDIEKHNETWTTNTAGLEFAVVTSPRTLATRLPPAWPLARRWATWQAEMNQARLHRRPLFFGLAAFLLALFAAAAWRMRREEAAALGVAVVFSLLVLSCYYWVMLSLLFVRRGFATVAGLLFLNAAILTLAMLTSDTQFVYAAFSWGLLALFVGAFVWDAPGLLRPEPGPGRSR